MNLTRIVFLSSLVLSGVSLGRTTTQVQVFASPSVVYETQVFDLKAQVFGAAPTGSVTFLSAGGVVLGQGNVAFNVATGLYEAVLSGVLPDGFGGTSIIEGVRKATITGDYSGDAANAPSSGSYFLTLKPRVATTSSVVANPSTAAVGQEVTIVTTVSGFVDGLGIVRLYDDGRFLELGSTGFPTRGICSIKVRFTTAGVHLIGSAYSLSKTDLPSFASGIDVTVVPGSSATALTLAPTSAYQNNAVTLTAVVSGSGPTGTVTFRDGPTVLGTANIVSGKATLSPTFTSTGSHSISASYSGDTNNQASASATATLVINAKLSTTTVLTSNAATVYAGQAVTFTSTVTGASPTGSATFKSGATTLSTVSLTAGKASLAWKFAAASAPVIQAVYSGDTNNASSNSSPVTVTVAPQVVPMLTLTPSVASAELYQPVTLTAQLSGTGPGPESTSVKFLDGAIVLGTVVEDANHRASLTISFNGAGVHALSAVSSGNTSDVSRTATASLTVKQRVTTVSLSAAPMATYQGQDVVLQASGFNIATAPLQYATLSFYDGVTLLSRITTVSSARVVVRLSTLGTRTLSVLVQRLPSVLGSWA